MQYLFGILMFLTSLFLILLVLVQRGRGGGLAGAFGGMGGQSAFGTKAGDLFTKITMFTATFWILLCVTSIAVLNRQQQENQFGADGGASGPGAIGSVPGDEPDAEGSSGLSDEASSDAATIDPLSAPTTGAGQATTGAEGKDAPADTGASETGTPDSGAGGAAAAPDDSGTGAGESGSETAAPADSDTDTK